MLTVFSCLVPDVWNLIFDLLPVIDLLAMSRACKRIRRLVKQYWTMTFKISKLLSPFIAFDDVASFRRSLRAAEGLISGSVALQFFDRRTFDRLASLDIYVQYQKSDIVEAWLRSHGAIGVPQDWGDTDVAADLHIV